MKNEIGNLLVGFYSHAKPRHGVPDHHNAQPGLCAAELLPPARDHQQLASDFLSFISLPLGALDRGRASNLGEGRVFPDCGQGLPPGLELQPGETGGIGAQAQL